MYMNTKDLNKLSQTYSIEELQLLDSILIDHHLSKSEFVKIALDKGYELEDYVSETLSTNQPRGITWDETSMLLIEDKNRILAPKYEFQNHKEWVDAVWYTSEEIGDKDDINFLYNLDYKQWKDQTQEERDRFSEIVQKHIKHFKAQSEEARRKIAEIKERWREYKIFKRRDKLAIKIDELKKEWTDCNKDLKELPPSNCPSILPQENFNGALYLLASDLIEEMRNGEHQWANQNNILLFRWACFKYTCNGEIFSAKQMQSSYNTAKSRPSMLDM